MARRRRRLEAGDRVPRRFDLTIPGLDGDEPRPGRSRDRLQVPTLTTDPAVYNHRVDVLMILHERLHDDAIRALRAGLFDIVALDRAFGDGRSLSGVSKLIQERQAAERRRQEARAKAKRLLAPLVETYLAEEGGRAPWQKRQKLERFLGHLGGTEVAETTDVTRNRIAAFLAGLTCTSRKRPRDKAGKVIPGAPHALTTTPVSGSTYNRYLDTIRGFCSWAKRAGHIAVHPYADNGIPKRDENAHRLPDLSPAEYRDYLAHVATENPELVLVFQLLMHTGIDLEELERLRAMDVVFTDTAARLRVRRNKTRTPERQVPVPARVVPALRAWIALHGYRGTDRIFRKFGRALIRGQHERSRRVIHRPEFRMKDMRHIAAIYWRRAGVDIQTIQKWLGHASITQTSVYSDFGQDDAWDAPQAEGAASQLAAEMDVTPMTQLSPVSSTRDQSGRRRVAR